MNHSASANREGRWSAVIFRWTLGVGIICAALTGLSLLAGYRLASGTLAYSSTRPRYFPNIYLLDVNREWSWPLTRGDVSHNFPEWSRDGHEVLFTACDLTQCEAEAVNANGGDIHPVDKDAYVDLIYASPDGSRALAILNPGQLNTDIVLINRSDGSRHQITTTDSADGMAAWSPDGKQIVFASTRDRNWEIYVMNADGSNPRRLTFNAADDIEPAWSPDGRHIAFSSDRDGYHNLYIMDTDGSNVRQLTWGTWDNESPAWRP